MPTVFVESMLEIHTKYKELIRDVFCSDPLFIGALNRVRVVIKFISNKILFEFRNVNLFSIVKISNSTRRRRDPSLAVPPDSLLGGRCLFRLDYIHF